MASQIVGGLDGINRNLKPSDADDAPYEAPRTLLPKSLENALNKLDNSQLIREAFGDTYVDYYLGIKNAELDRYNSYTQENGNQDDENGISQWEQNEYFDFF